MTGSSRRRGSGKVLTYEGTGSILAVRTATGVKVPGIADQITGGLEAIFGGPAGRGGGAPGGDEGRHAQAAGAAGAGRARSSRPRRWRPRDATPPIPENDKWVVAMAFILVLLTVFGLMIFV